MTDSTPLLLSRRAALKAAASGFGYLAFAGLSTWSAERARPTTAVGPLAPKLPQFPARAKRVIFLCMEGGPSHVDTFDHKPKLAIDAGRRFGDGARGGQLMPSAWKFNRHGQSGLWISELFPQVARHADDLCVINSMQTDLPNHPQAFAQMHTGAFQFRRPSVGAWTLYGLGTENQDLPGFVTISPPANLCGPLNYGSSFLPAAYQGTRIGFSNRPVADAAIANATNPRSSTAAQRLQLDFLQSVNRRALEREIVSPELEGVIDSYELAFRMQGALPKLMDLSGETEATRRLYGMGDQATDDFARQCLLARRFVEAGVRFVELCHGGWDQHRQLKEAHGRNAAAVDKPIAGLLADLKGRDLLKDTLVIWGGEFGRAPYAQGSDGRDHNAKGYSLWMAGGGVRGGLAFGRTDDYGYEAVDDKVHVHDWHATILHLLGLDHQKLTYRYAGRDVRLTDVKGNVVKGILA
ncbi:DUF1501 domain-containing protein [Singulisphaera sp. Ch08]|uniref:DUF1501 domain-containing protein n=1 Tax=Singulisphaera sp. Ch08 TaxID=3120278 RepID=A0AAU7C9U5_9BACT